MRNKHILINIDDDIYNKIESLAALDRRPVSTYIYLLVIDEILKRYKDAHDKNNN